MALVLFLETAQLNYSQYHTAKEFSYFTAARKMPTKKKCQKLRCWRFKVRKELETLERTVQVKHSSWGTTPRTGGEYELSLELSIFSVTQKLFLNSSSFLQDSGTLWQHIPGCTHVFISNLHMILGSFMALHIKYKRLGRDKLCSTEDKPH